MIHTFAQGSPEWHDIRRGRATSSKFADILATVKSGEAASRRNYRMQLALERITGRTQQGFVSDAMEDGQTNEPRARNAFEAATGLIAQEVGFVDLGEWIGASPDGLIGSDEGLECKCYIPANHYDTLVSKTMPPKHRAQVQGNLWITGRQRWHFASFNPDFPPALRLFHCVIERDNDYIAMLEIEVNKFLSEVDAMVNKLNELKAAA